MSILDTNYDYDVIIFGAGFAGSVMAYRLKKLNILVVEKENIGSHEASYYLPLEVLKELKLEHLTKQTINEFTYEVDTIDYCSVEPTDGGFANVKYKDICSTLLKGVNTIIGEFIKFTDRSLRTVHVRIKDDDVYLKAKVVIDATGWESPIRKSTSLPYPKIGPNTVLWKLSNCRIDNPQRMILCVGDFASLGFWAEPQSDTEMLVGSGYWTHLDKPISNREKILLDKLISLYLYKYRDMFENAIVVEKHYAKIAVDPVKTIIKNNIITFGEAGGMTNPYWLLGSGLFSDLSDEFSNYIIQAVETDSITKRIEILNNIQQNWNEYLSNKYKKLWASARVIWNGNAKDWLSIFERREKLKKYTTPNQKINRQRGGDYSKFYAIKLLGFGKIVRVVRYMLLFDRRQNKPKIFIKNRLKFRPPTYIDLRSPETKSKLMLLNNHFKENSVRISKNRKNEIDQFPIIQDI